MFLQNRRCEIKPTLVDNGEADPLQDGTGSTPTSGPTGSKVRENVRIVVMVSIAFVVVVRIVGALECKGNLNSWTHYGVDSHLPSFCGLQRAIRGKFRQSNNQDPPVAW